MNTKALHYLYYFLFVPLLIAGAGFCIALYRKYTFLDQHRQNAEEAWSAVDNLCKHRLNEISRLINLLDAYIKGECEPLKKLQSIKNRYQIAKIAKDLIYLNQQIPPTLLALANIAQSNPEIINHYYYQEITNRLAHFSDSIDRERRKYNGFVQELNTLLLTNPFTWIGMITGISSKDMFPDRKDDLYLSEVKFTFPQPPPL